MVVTNQQYTLCGWSKSRNMSSAISWNYQESPEARQENGKNGTLAGDQEANEILTTRSTNIQPGTSAASNQRAAFLKPPRMAAGCSHSTLANLPAAKSTRASIRTLFTMSHNPPPPRRVAVKNKGLWACVNQCFFDRNLSQTEMAVYIFQHRTTLHLPVVCVKPIYWKVSEMSGPLPDARRE